MKFSIYRAPVTVGVGFWWRMRKEFVLDLFFIILRWQPEDQDEQPS